MLETVEYFMNPDNFIQIRIDDDTYIIENILGRETFKGTLNLKSKKLYVNFVDELNYNEKYTIKLK